MRPPVCQDPLRYPDGNHRRETRVTTHNSLPPSRFETIHNSHATKMPTTVLANHKPSSASFFLVGTHVRSPWAYRGQTTQLGMQPQSIVASHIYTPLFSSFQSPCIFLSVHNKIHASLTFEKFLRWRPTSCEKENTVSCITVPFSRGPWTNWVHVTSLPRQQSLPKSLQTLEFPVQPISLKTIDFDCWSSCGAQKNREESRVPPYPAPSSRGLSD